MIALECRYSVVACQPVYPSPQILPVMEWFKNNLALASLCLLIVGMLKTIFYYSEFSVDIVSFLEFSEIFQLQYLFFYMVTIGFYTLFTLLQRPIYRFIDRTTISTTLLLSIPVALSVPIALLVNYWQVKQIKTNHHSAFEVSMIVDSAKVKTDSTLYFIGRTKGYLFLYDLKKEKSFVYANDDVKKLTFSKGIDYNEMPAVSAAKSKASKMASDSTSIKTLPSH